ncbi:hypothetical protein HNR53_003174 [Bacillus benzoevorans]|uniref:Uncharacterized protein n=2 Tax=Bacillus benzoevorans TaxID=1456 RepID=A0A7X0LWC5_9BACI|nr:hypothetical protein [Bacillus benzoevorans]
MNQMSEQDELLKQILLEVQSMKVNMATKGDIEVINYKLDKLTENVEKQHIANINSDNILLNEIRSIREGVVYVNRKIADTELELNMMKQNVKQ